MKIVLLAHRAWPSVGGVEKYLHELALALRQLGHEPVIVAATHADGLPPSDQHEGILILRFPATRSSMRCRWWFRRHRELFRGADVVSISNTHVWEYAWPWIAKWVDPRRVFLIRHGMAMKFPVPREHVVRAARAQSAVAGVVHDGRFISTWLGVPADLCPDQGLRPTADRLPVWPTARRDSALFIGRLEPDTGVMAYVDAAAELDPERTGRFRLDLCGEGSLRGDLEAQVREEKLAVRFLGRVPEAQELLQEYDFAFVDGRMAIQEAMARQRPVLSAYSTPLKRDYLREESFSPYLFAAPTGLEIAARVRELSENPAVYRSTVDRAFEFARTLCWISTAQQYLEFWARRTEASPRHASIPDGAIAAP